MPYKCDDFFFVIVAPRTKVCIITPLTFFEYYISGEKAGYYMMKYGTSVL
jgi:hypothetical protein